MTSESGAITASAVMAMTMKRKIFIPIRPSPRNDLEEICPPPISSPSGANCSLPFHGRLPRLQKLEPLLGVETREQFLADWNRFGLVADKFSDALGGGLTFHVIAQRVEFGGAGDQGLAA